jgi:hypothetical protein
MNLVEKACQTRDKKRYINGKSKRVHPKRGANYCTCARCADDLFYNNQKRMPADIFEQLQNTKYIED